MDKDYEQTLELARRFDSFMKESKAIAGLIEQQEIFMEMTITKNVHDFPANMQKFCFPTEKYVGHQKQGREIKLNLEMTFATQEQLTSTGNELFRKAAKCSRPTWFFV